ncbi:MAG: TIGR02281 family clan AA aspartic protease [Paracoccaceae bacterium]
MSADDTGRLIYLAILLVAVGGWIAVEYRTRIGFALRTVLAWGMIFLGVMAGYGLWQDIRDDVMPRQMVNEGGEIEVPRAQDGHYYLTLDIHGQRVRFLADTGATSVVLTRADAEKLGFAPDGLAYIGTAQTANGMVRTARVTLQDVELGHFKDTRVPAWVNEGELDTSLLGMDYLRRFRIAIEGNKMVLSR